MGEAKRKRARLGDLKAEGGGPKLTGRTILYFLGICLALDVLLYLVMRLGFGACYGILCLFE